MADLIVTDMVYWVNEVMAILSVAAMKKCIWLLSVRLTDGNFVLLARYVKSANAD